MNKEILSISINESTIDILNVLCSNSDKTIDKIIEEALWIVFEKYKSLIIYSTKL